MSVRIVFLGEGRVGKTSIGKRWADGTFDQSTPSTVSASFFMKKVTARGKTFDIQLWDTAGQEEYHSLTPIYYKDAHAAILVYSITDVDSFHRIQQWKKELDSNRGEGIKLFIAANKCDLSSQRVVSKDSGKNIASQYGAPYFEVSAKTGFGISEMFQEIANSLAELPLKRAPSKRLHALNVIDAEEKTKDKSGCC